MKLKCLPYKGKIGSEIRPLYFYKAMGLEIVDARIISFGACNFSCPYCKREGNFRDTDGSIISSISTTLDELYGVVEDAVAKQQVVRISGGDPVVYPEASILLAERVKKLGSRFSVAHNGSSPQFVKRLVDIGLESAAIDLKAPVEMMNSRTGLSNGSGARMYQKSIETQDLLSSSGILVDVRTPIFSSTTLDDMLELAQDVIKGGDGKNEFWTWRLYKPVVGCDWEPPRNLEDVIWMIGEVKNHYPTLKIGLRAKWEPSGFLYF
ncbi:MAG: radical SAM protein [Patescibacteria group bacterium]